MVDEFTAISCTLVKWLLGVQAVAEKSLNAKLLQEKFTPE